MPVNISNQAALIKIAEIPLGGLNQQLLSHKMLKITSLLESEIPCLGIQVMRYCNKMNQVH